jgi:energy-coupling factor transporter ATP-binding protein EcfA2
MPLDIVKIHQEVFNLLMRYHAKNPDFLFSFRKINRKARLDQGYWFLGSDYYLTVTFWTGRDWVTRMPKISFTIHNTGGTVLDLNAKDVSQRMDFFDKKLVNMLGAKPRGYNEGYYKEYDQFNHNEYLESLEHFLNNDKVIIDDMVRAKRAFSAAALKYTDAIGFIYREQFKLELKNVQRYQEKLKLKLKNTGFLKYFRILNFSPIADIKIEDIPDGCRWIFITGENGAGKTSILKALATGLTSNIDGGEPVADVKSDFVLELGFDSVNGVVSRTISHNDPLDGRKWLAKGLAFYGPVRLFTQGNIDRQFFRVDERKFTDLATYGLFHSINLLKDLKSSGLLDRPKYHEMALQGLVENLEEILPGMVFINYEMESDGSAELTFYLERPGGEIPVAGVSFNQLPSGTRNFVAIILDLLMRLRNQQPNVYDLAEYTGIVLIDEIDLHLHPKMQKEIVIQLSATFPNIQFIVTTHSPIPLLGAPRNSIFINVNREDSWNVVAKRLDIDVTNLLPNTILSSPIFNFNEMAGKELAEDERLVSEDDYNEHVFYKILERKIRERTLRRNR